MKIFIIFVIFNQCLSRQKNASPVNFQEFKKNLSDLDKEYKHQFNIFPIPQKLTKNISNNIDYLYFRKQLIKTNDVLVLLNQNYKVKAGMLYLKALLNADSIKFDQIFKNVRGWRCKDCKAYCLNFGQCNCFKGNYVRIHLKDTPLQHWQCKICNQKNLISNLSCKFCHEISCSPFYKKK